MHLLDMLLQSFLTVFLLVLVSLVGVFICFVRFRSKKDKITLKKAKRVVFNLKTITEDSTGSYVESGQVKHHDVVEALKHLATDEQIEEVILLIDELHLTAAQIDEYRPLFEDISKHKKVIAFGSQFDVSSYRSALLADKIYALKSRNSQFYLTGFSNRDFYWKKFLQKLGIIMHVLHIGDYKAYGENFGREEMSPERKASISLLQDKQFMLLAESIQDKRQVDITKALLNGELALVGVDVAKNHSLIDDALLINELGIDYKKDTLSFTDYMSQYQSKKNKAKNSIAVVFLEGGISPSGKGISYEAVVEKIDKIKEDSTVKGIVLRINSPGGSALEAEKIYQYLQTVDKPIYVSMGNVCASGGYYIACSAQKLYANTHTLTGSIGVVMVLPNISQTIEKLDIMPQVVEQGTGQQILDVTRPLDNFSKEKLLLSMQAVYEEFKERVTQARHISNEDLEAIAQGRVWLGTQAKENGLVDHIGSLHQCIVDLANDLNLTQYTVEPIYTEKTVKNSLAALKIAGMTHQTIEQVEWLINNDKQFLYWEDLPW